MISILNSIQITQNSFKGYTNIDESIEAKSINHLKKSNYKTPNENTKQNL